MTGRACERTPADLLAGQHSPHRAMQGEGGPGFPDTWERSPGCLQPIRWSSVAVELARQSGKPIAEIVPDSGIAESCLRRWMKQDDIDAGRAEGLSTDERAELVRLRRELRVAQMEIEILKRASAYFARENVLPK